MKLYINKEIIPFEFNCTNGYNELQKYKIDETKFIRLMTDYCAYPIWDFEGGNMSYTDIPNISIETIISLEKLRKTFDSGDCDVYDASKDILLEKLLDNSFSLLINDFPDYTIWMF